MTVYLDNSATTKPSEGVIQAVTRALSEGFYNPSSMYAPSLEVEKLLNACRDRIRAALNAQGAEVIFTSGGTESNNLALRGTLEASRPPVRIAVSAGEHPSVFETAQELIKSRGELVILPLTGKGCVEMSAVEAELKKGLTLLSIMHVNNETGAINDIDEIARLKNTLCPDCRLHVDGVQGFLREDIDFFKGIDLYTLSAHKIHALKGTGALVIKKGVRLKAVNIGGGQENGLRSGTENTPGILALSQAIDEMVAMESRRKTMSEIKMQLHRLLKEAIPACAVNGPEPANGACHILNVSFPGVRGETMLHALEEKGVLVSTGSACSARRTRGSRVLEAIGVSPKLRESAVRFSLSPYTAADEIAFAAQAVKSAYDLLVKYQRR